MAIQILDNGVLRDATDDEVLEIEARASAAFEVARSGAIAATYTDVDVIYDAAVGRRATEYQEAEQAARDYAAAGYMGAVSEYVSDYALNNPTLQVQTNQWAADEIISRADAFRAAQKSMRSQRFASQAAMRAASTPAELEAAVAAWSDFIAGLRADLGL